MDPIEEILMFKYAGNTGFDYLVAIGIFVLLLLLLKIVQVVILSRLLKLAKKTKTKVDDLVIEIFRTIKPPFYLLISLYLALQWLKIPEIVNQILYVLIVIFVVYEIIAITQKVIDFFLQDYIKKIEKQDGKKKAAQQTKQMMKVLQILLKVIVWFIGAILILSNLGIEVSSLIASLGIGGIAIALAIQNILSDLFASFSLYVDKPFEVGDFISIGDDSGTVQKIGLKTTRLKTLQGEELVVSNHELTSARIQNFKRIKKRSVFFETGVTYSTSHENLTKIPAIMKEVINSVKDVEFERSHLDKYGDSAILFETVYKVNSSEYAVFMDVKQEINLGIFKAFEKEGIDFAFPSQSIYVEKMKK